MSSELKVRNLKHLLEKTTFVHKNNILYNLEERKITYNDFYEKVVALKNSLINIGLKDKKIAIISENRYEWEVTFFAVTTGVGILVPMDRTWSKDEIENVINIAEVEAIFCSKKYENMINEIKKNNKYLKCIISFDSNEIDSFERLLEIKNTNKEKDLVLIEQDVDEEKTCLIIFTSGTTKSSKAVMLSNINICSNVINVSKVFDLNENDIVLSILPLNHVLEGLFCFLQSIYVGAQRVFCNEIDEIIEYIHKYKISFMGGVPAIYEYLYKRKEELVIESKHINMFMSGGAKLKPDLILKYKEIGINLIQGYGLTECSPVVSLENKKYNKKGSVGKIIPNIEIQIKDINEDGIGELLVKGENVTKGYFKNEEETKKNIQNEWLHTGDLVKIDENGYVYIFGRSKELIVLQNGKKVFPEEIENLLNKIKGIKESFVFGNNNKIYAKIVYDSKEFINLSEEEIYKIIKNKVKRINQSIAEYKKIYNFIISNERLERTSIGKIKRNLELEKIKSNLKKTDENLKNKKEKNIEIIRKIFTSTLDDNEIELDTDINELGADSLDKVEIFLKVEKEFNIKLGTEQKRTIKSIHDVLNLL